MGYNRTMERNAAGGRTAQLYVDHSGLRPREGRYAGGRGAGTRSRETAGAGRQSVRRPGMGNQGGRMENGRTRNIGRQTAAKADSGQRDARAQGRSRAGARTAAARRARRKRRRALAFLKFAVFLFLVFGTLVTVRGAVTLAGFLSEALEKERGEEPRSLILPEEDTGALYADKYGEKLAELLELNEEAADYVKSYPERESYKSRLIDLTEELQAGGVPLLMQWDKRWGYNAYGGNMIGLAGCGPVCLTMAYLHFTGDTGMTPREMAAFAYDNGYYVEDAGTKWSLWTEGVGKLGLSGKELSLDESVMRQALDAGELIVCSMGPGDFTTEGHFILIRGYDENGFYVNDPNRRSNSERQWDFDALRSQIRNLWSLRG